MAKAAKKSANAQSNPQAEERKRLKKLAISKAILSDDGPAKVSSSTSSSSSVIALSPSKTVAKHHGRDILRKSQRKNKFLFSFPGHLAPLSGGKIGDLKDLGTKNPILYLDFPQGRMKLFGTIIFPKNRYLTLQFSKGGKNVMCEDNFDTMIVFSEAWWIGTKDENPEEIRLDFPKEMNMGQDTEYDFKGGAGSTCEREQSVKKREIEFVEHQSPKTESADDLSDSPNELNYPTAMTPTRHSTRTAGKSYKFAEASSGDDSAENNTEASEEEEKKVDLEFPIKHYTYGKSDDSDPLDFNTTDAVAHTTSIAEKIQESSVTVKKSKGPASSNKSSLVQATISTLFKKVEDKKAPGQQRQSSSSKDPNEILQHKDSKRKIDLGNKAPGKQRQSSSSKDPDEILQHKDSKWKIDQENVRGPSKKGKVTKEMKAGTKRTARNRKFEDEDDIEEFSSMSEDAIGSDEDWAA